MSNDTRPHGDEGQYIVLVAFDVYGHSMKDAQVRLARGLENVIDRGIADSWWVAEDERYDGSDNDSAVFVPKGSQTAFARLVADERGAVREAVPVDGEKILDSLSEILYPGGDTASEWNGGDVCERVAALLRDHRTFGGAEL